VKSKERHLERASDVRLTGDFTERTLGGIPLWDDGDGSWRSPEWSSTGIGPITTRPALASAIPTGVRIAS
jgi:hypothetical protein